MRKEDCACGKLPTTKYRFKRVPESELLDHPHRRTHAGIKAVLPRKLAVSALVDHSLVRRGEVRVNKGRIGRKKNIEASLRGESRFWHGLSGPVMKRPLIATLAVLLYHRVRGELPMTPFGWRLLGGPYPEIGTDRLTPLGWALAWLLVAVSCVDVLIGRWLWRGRRRGAILALVLAPVSLALGWVFALPYLLVMAPLRAVAAVVALRDLRR